ncbi:MAG: WD40 repeat domain-containing protein [Xenococcaceae cyanobacterium]
MARISHQGDVRAVAFSPDSQYLATGSEDNTARLIEVTTGKEIARISHQGDVYAVAFGPDSQYLATGSEDNTARLDFLDSNELMREACRHLKRNLTVDEWQDIDVPLRLYDKTCEDYPIHPSFLEEGKRLAQTDNLKAAIAIFRRAQQLDPDIDLNPETQETIEKDPKAVALKWAALGKVEEERD